MIANRICAECGPTALSHSVEWTSALFDTFFLHVSSGFDIFDRALTRMFLPFHLAQLGLPMFKILGALRLVVLTTALDNKDSLRTKASWESADRLGVKLWQFRIFGNPDASIFVAEKDGKHRVFDGLPRPARVPSPSLRWMDNKGVLRAHFAKARIPIAQGGACFTLAQAKKILHAVGDSVITKPHIGSHSRHTTMNIKTESELESAFRSAKQLSPLVIVEEELRGFVFRGTLVGGKLVGVVRREPPWVTGDGSSMVRELVQKENQNPKRRGPIFHEIPLGKEAEAELKLQNLTLDDVPSEGRMVTLHAKVSRGNGASTTELTRETHPDNVELFENAAIVLQDSLVGIDVIVQDITKSWKMQKKCGVIECNSLPFIDLHHYPLYGEPNLVGDYLWEKAFSA